MFIKLGTVLTSSRRFRMHTLKSSITCFCIFFYCCSRCEWAIPHRTSQHDFPWAFMPCAVQLITTDFSKHVESCSLATKNMISLLPRCKWPPNMESVNLSGKTSLLTLWLRDKRDAMWQTEKNIPPLSQDLWPVNLAESWLQTEVSKNKPFITDFLCFFFCFAYEG